MGMVAECQTRGGGEDARQAGLQSHLQALQAGGMQVRAADYYFNGQGVVTYALPLEAFVKGIKNFDRP